MSGKGFLSRILGANADEDETRILSTGEIGAGKPKEKESEEELRTRGFTVERVAGIIDELPPDVPRESALRIVRGTLAATGVGVEDIERATRVRGAKLDSVIEHAQGRQRDLRERTEEVVRSLKEEIRKAREARDTGVAEEEERIARARAGLKEVRRVRAFFGFPEAEEKEPADPADGPIDDETQVLEPSDADRTRVMRRPDSLSDTDELAGDPSKYGDPRDATGER